MERFPALRLILRFGRLWSLLVAVLATIAITWILVAALGPLSYLAVIPSLAFFYFFAKSYVEIVQIVVEMVH